MIDYEKFVFAAPPRTGSTWFIKAAADAGLGEASKTHLHTKANPDANRYSVSLVRHPCEWLASYFFALQGGHTGVPEVDMLAELAKDCYSFDDFAHGYVRNFEGHISKIMLGYQADSYIRTCDLQAGTWELFLTMGVPPRIAMTATALDPQNQCNYDVHWSPIVWQKIVNTEPISEMFEFD